MGRKGPGEEDITKQRGEKIWPILGLSILSQLGLTLFETAFALYAQAKLGYGPAQVCIAFMVCGSVMALFQGIAVGYLSGRVREMPQLAVGFSLMGTGIALFLVIGSISLLALGMAFISPKVAALTSKWKKQVDVLLK